MKRVYAASRKKINDHGQTLKTGKAAQIKDAYRERWTMLAQTQRAERRELWRREDSFLSRLFNGLSLLREIRQNHEGNAFLMVLALMSRQGQMSALATRHEATRQVAREVRAADMQKINLFDLALSTPTEISREAPNEKSLVGRVSVISRRVDRGSCFRVVDRGGVAPARVAG